MTERIVPIESIRIGDNPRTFFDDAKQKELVASIKAVGLIVPPTVSEPGDGTYALIAGERRLRALTELGITEVPVYISTTTQHRGARVIENVVRADLHPIEEGRAYLALMTDGPKVKSATALGKELGIHKGRISDRAKLAVLPTDIADILIAGSVLNALMHELVAFTEAFGAEVVSRFVESSLTELTELATPDTEDRYGERGDIHDAFSKFLDGAPDVDVVHLTGQHAIERAAPTPEAYEALAANVKAVLGSYGRVHLLDEDFDAMRAYGALREFKLNDWQDETYCTSKTWLWDRIGVAFDRQKKEAEETGKGRPTDGRGVTIPGKPLDPVKQAKAENREPTPEEEAASAKLKAEAKEQRDAAKALREEAGRRNQALALGAAKAFDVHKLRVSDAKLLVQIIVTGNGLVHGWELCQAKELEGNDAGIKARSLRDWINRGKGVDGIIGRLFQVIACGAYADNEALPPSKRKSLAFDLHNDKPELLAVARLAMPEDRYRVMAEAIAVQAAARELEERKWAWRNERTHQGVMYGDYQGLAPSHKHAFDPTSEAPVYITDLNFSTTTSDVFEMVAMKVADTGQVLEMPDGWTYDGGGSIREVSDEHPAFRPWVGEPFNRRLPQPEVPVAEEVGSREDTPHANGDGPMGSGDPEGDAINEELDRQQAEEFANATHEEE